jgi:iron complex outermembrane receptor protein
MKWGDSMKSFRHKVGSFLCFFLGVSAFIGAPVITLAQKSQGSDDSNTLAEVVVTATKRAENTVDVPIAITTKSGDDLAAAQIPMVSDLTQVIPGLNYTYGNSARPSLRGVTSLSSSAGAENNVAIYIDGIYQPSLQGNSQIDLPDIADVEVFKGPQGTLFGRNAEGGAIVITSRNPSFTPTGNIEVSDGTYDGGYKGGYDAKVQGFLSGPVSDTVALSIAWLYRSDPGYAHDVIYGGRHGKLDTQFVRAKALFKPTDNAEILVIAYYGENDDASVFNLQNLNPLKAVPQVAPTEPYYVANGAPDRAQTARYGTTVKGTFTFDAGTFTSLSGVNFVQTESIADGGGTSAPLLVYLTELPNRLVSQEFDFASRKFGDFSFVSGAYGSNVVETYEPLQVVEAVTGPVLFTDYAKSTDIAYALFAEGNYDITKQLILVAGIRYSWEEREYQGSVESVQPLPMIGKADFHAFTPRFSIRYKVADQTDVYFTYSKGFKSGLFDTTSFSDHVIQPETLKAYELGIKSDPLPSLQVSASVYHYDVFNLQVQTNTASGVSALSNAGSAEIDGGEFELTWRAMRPLTLSTGVSYIPTARYRNYQNAPIVEPDFVNGGGYNAVVNESYDRLAQTPRFQANVQIRYEDDFSFGKMGASVSAFDSSGFPFELSGFIYQKSYQVVNASVSWQPTFSPNSKLTLWGKNITNSVYMGDYLTNGAAFDVVYQAPRELGVSYGYSF